MVNHSVDKNSDILPLYIQIRDAIQVAIRAAELHLGDRLPAVASLTREIGVTQATIRRALQDLCDAGQACCHVGRGTFILNPTTLIEITDPLGSYALRAEIARRFTAQETKVAPEQSVVISSLSKSVMTGLRLGWLISSAQLVQELAQLKRLMDHSSPGLIQGLALTIFQSVRFDAHTRHMALLYQQRREAMLQSPRPLYAERGDLDQAGRRLLPASRTAVWVFQRRPVPLGHRPGRCQ